MLNIFLVLHNFFFIFMYNFIFSALLHLFECLFLGEVCPDRSFFPFQINFQFYFLFEFFGWLVELDSSLSGGSQTEKKIYIFLYILSCSYVTGGFTEKSFYGTCPQTSGEGGGAGFPYTYHSSHQNPVKKGCV